MIKKLCAFLMIGTWVVGGWPYELAASEIPTHKEQVEDFFYAQQTSLWIFYRVPKEVVQKQIGENLENLKLDLVSFENESEFAYLILKPMVFMAEFGGQTASIPGTSASTEVEFTALVRPKKNNGESVPTFRQFLAGNVKSASIGQLRLDVLCDGEVAVAAGRKNFGEHKFLGSFEYEYSTPNNQLGSTAPFSMKMTAYTWQGAGVEEKKMFQVKVDLKGLPAITTKFSPEILYSALPPEPQAGIRQQTVGEYRHYDNANFKVFDAQASKVQLSYGNAKGAEILRPVAPFGDGMPIAGSENWPTDMIDRMKNTLSQGEVAAYLLYRSPSAEYESKPFEVK